MSITGTGSSMAALILDFGGVLTASTTEATRAWCAEAGITYRQFVGPLIAEHDGAPSLIHLLETGQLAVGEFELRLGAAITDASGIAVDAAGFTRDVVGAARLDDAMFELVDDARARGLRTALLSNSWGNGYPMRVLREHLDEVVISGEVGLRKPDPAIYRLTAQRLGIPARQCVFVDDLKNNVAAAEQVGMRGILHTDAVATRTALTDILADGPTAPT